MMALLALFLAHAGGVYAGIPVRGVTGVGEPTFLTPELGWTAAVDGGWVRVFVGETEDEAAEWYARQLGSIGRTPDPYALAGVDDAHGDGTTLVAFREGNIGVVLCTRSNARKLATTLRDAIVPAGPTATAAVGEPRLVSCEDVGRCVVEADGAAAIRAPGAGAAKANRLLLPRGATEAWVWDAYGRVKIVRLPAE